MNSTDLDSDYLGRAAQEFKQAVESFRVNGFAIRVDGFEQAVRDFQMSVDKLQRLMGMQAENMQRAAVGASMAYTEEDFVCA